MGRLRARPVRPGQELDDDRQGPDRRHRVALVDLPNHGHSPWTDRVDYLDMAELLATELDHLGEPVTLVGHSMGGKVAMQLALRRPELLRALVVVDVAPADYPAKGGRTEDPDEEASPFAAYIDAMRALDLDALQSRGDADEALKEAVPSTMVRSFLLQSLVREGVRLGRQRLALEAEPGRARPGPRRPSAASRATARRDVRRTGALDRRGQLDLRAPRGPPPHGRAVPRHPAGDDQERRPLGALRAAGDLHRDPAQVPGNGPRRPRSVARAAAERRDGERREHGGQQERPAHRPPPGSAAATRRRARPAGRSPRARGTPG